MKHFLIAPLLMHLVAANASDSSLISRFLDFQSRHARNYANDDEMELRFSYFQKASQKIKQLNAESTEAVFAENKFADWTDEELAKLVTKIKPATRTDFASNLKLYKYFKTDIETPLSMDWRTDGHVSPVKDQGSCGSCYAFTAVAAIESMYSIAGLGMHNFSEQQIVDCDTSNSQCEGGTMINAFKYLSSAGVTFGVQYPYTGTASKCKLSAKNSLQTVPISGSYFIESENELEYFVGTQGPASIGIKAPNSLFYYAGGVWSPSFAECNETDSYHALTIVGYDSTSSGTPYWIAKNSWNTDWGENGFIRIKKGVDSCGMATYAGYGQNSAPLLTASDEPLSVVDPVLSAESRLCALTALLICTLCL